MDKLYPVRGKGTTAGEYLGGLAASTIEGLLSSGKLKRTKVSRRTMVKESELIRYINACGSEPSPGGARRRSAVPTTEVSA
jgi:hypothetical protein